jgi:FAD/FMN-containing dehydrogenase
VRWACAQGIPLTPRGKATSGYGGAVPLKKGLVIDFYRMKKIIRIDPEKQTAAVEAGWCGKSSIRSWPNTA